MTGSKKERIAGSMIKSKMARNLKHIRVNATTFKVLEHWFWKAYSGLNWEPDTYHIFKKYLNKESIYVDVGTWIGPTIFYAYELGVRAIFGAEANPNSFQMVVDNCKLNGIDAKIMNFCIHSTNELVSFGNANGSTATSSASSVRGNTWKVQGITLRKFLEDFCPPNWDFLKIDIEGAEELLLSDLRQLSLRRNTKILLSLHAPFWSDRNKLTPMFLDAIKDFELSTSKRQPITLSDLEKRLTTEERRPRWGTKFGNFFEILLESKC